MGKDFRYSKEDAYDYDGRSDRHGGYDNQDRNKRNKKRAKSAMSRKQRQHQDF